ncbi:hypothetical protein GX51_07863 [Blastomyces parvus]|uniref:DUF6546 domain-containing protein n=1 Tax=Blastomyces parvus TaxID=2060905 RepID=A0A2B7WII3_9EURO|nr:hypothetical protein GX51_07863 [Blastomyces parvus]
MSKRQDDNDPCGRIVHDSKGLRTRTDGSWASLPAEIRLTILEEISRQKHRGWASCAAVCKEWQVFVEAKNFRRLTLQTSCLEEFKYMVVRQRGLVQYICLNIELPRYTCRSCQCTESGSWNSRHNSIMRDAMVKLYSALSTWEPAGRLVLEITTYSPSDSQHWFKHYRFGRENHCEGDFVQSQEATTGWHDPNHGWVNGQQVEAPCASAILRLFSPLCLIPPKNLPEVHAVTGLVIPRQGRRQIFPPTLRLLCERLPRLESIVYEPWRVWRPPWKIMQDRELASIVQDALPSRTRTVSIFENFSDQIALALRNDTLYPSRIDTNPIADPILVNAFASRSRDFEHFSISFMIDARQFFNSCRLSYTWHHLQSLTLISSILTRTAPQNEIFTLLCDASLATLNMPRLERMVFWNSKQGEACAVIYHRENSHRRATLTWRGTWDLEFSHEVVECWKRVTSDSSILHIKNERVQGVISFHGDAIHLLRLPSRVVDPVSLWQMRQESMMQTMT